MRSLAFIIGVFLLLGVPSASYALMGFGLEASLGGWIQGDPEGTLMYDTGLAGTIPLDIKDDLGFKGKTRLMGRLKIEHPVPLVPNIYLMATPMSFEGTGTKNFDFGGLTVAGDFSSKLTLDHYDMALYWGVPFLGMATMGKLDAEFGLNARLINLSAEITDSTGQTESTGNVFLPVPMIYLGAQVKPIDLVAVEAEARGIAYGGNHYYSFIGRLKIKPFGPLFAAVGYRADDIKIDDADSVTAEMKFSGPFVEAGVQF